MKKQMHDYSEIEKIMEEWGVMDIWLALGTVTAPVPRWSIKQKDD